MRVLVAMDSWKGSLDAPTACAAAARGVAEALPGVEIDVCPLADGGEGTAAVVQALVGGEWVEREVAGPLPGARVRARYLWIAARRPRGGERGRPLAVVDLAAASGLTLVPREDLDPLQATTFGTGELVRHAIARGARRVWLALGGSATVDGGTGMAAALGWRLLDAGGEPIAPGGGGLGKLHRIEPPHGNERDGAVGAELASAPRGAGKLPPYMRNREGAGKLLPYTLGGIRVVALCDVENPLLGDRGAARVFGPQKGASATDVARLEHGLERLAAVIERDLGCDARGLQSGGAAGGAGAGAAAFLGARLLGGGRLLLRLARFDHRIAAADLVVTGEGRFDVQSLHGKVVSAVAGAARRRGVPAVVVAGRVALDDASARAHGIAAMEAAAPPDLGDAEALARAEALLASAAARLVARLPEA